jgi:hypothetical protein
MSRARINPKPVDRHHQNMKLANLIQNPRQSSSIITLCLLLTGAVIAAAEEEAPPPRPLEVDAANLRTFVELVRSDVKTQKGIILAQNMEFTDDEALEFWPLYREYDLELNALYDQRFALIRRWSPELDGEISPLGPLVAAAYGEGYRKSTGEKSGPQPFHGYCFKILTRQGINAPGGKYNYITNGNMIGGFALVAWPAEHGNSGVMTLIVNQQGKVYQKDLGPKTASIAQAMTEYDPDKSWTLSSK